MKRKTNNLVWQETDSGTYQSFIGELSHTQFYKTSRISEISEQHLCNV